MAGRQNLLPKLDMGAVKDKEKERTKFGASMKKLSASIKRGMTPRGSRTYSTDLGGEASSANNSVGGGSPLPGTPQKPDEYANDGLDDLKATIKQAQAMVTDEQPPSVPSTPEPADSADSLSHAIAQNAVHSAVADAEEDGPVPAAAPPPPQAPADNMGANGPVPEPQPADPEPEADLAPAPPAEPRGPAHAVVEPTGQPGDAVVRVHVAEPAKAPASEIEPAPVAAEQQKPTKRRGLRRHVTPRKVLAVASLAGLAYLAKDPVERHLEHRRLLLAPPPPLPPPKGPFSAFADLFK